MRHGWVLVGLVLLVLALAGNQTIAAITRSVSEIEALASDQENPPAADVQPEQGKQPEVIMHAVQSGETLSSIAANHGTDVASIMAVNNLSSANRLKIGQGLKVLNVKGLVHKVVSGDTLWDIARRYSVQVSDIEYANPSIREGALSLGKELIIPGGKAPARAVAVSRGSGGGATRGSASSGSASSVSSLGLRWPLSGHITSGFGYRWGKLHAAIDIGVPTGTTVRAASAGRVTYSGLASGYGYLVKINHGNGIETRYAHNSVLLVSVGQQVERGTAIAKSGNSGFSTGPHLHFEVRKDGKPLNPLTYLP